MSPPNPDPNSTHSTIAQVLSGREDGSGRKRSRQMAISESILRIVQERPGVSAAEIAREINEKDIFVLSLADELVRNGALVSSQRDGKLYLPSEPEIKKITIPSPGADIAVTYNKDNVCKDSDQGRDSARIRLAGLFIRLYRVLARMKEAEMTSGQGLTVRVGKENFLAARPLDNEISIVIYGTYPDSALVELTRFRDIKAHPINISSEKSVIELRCGTPEEVEALGPGLEKCYAHLLEGGGRPSAWKGWGTGKLS